MDGQITCYQIKKRAMPGPLFNNSFKLYDIIYDRT